MSFPVRMLSALFLTGAALLLLAGARMTGAGLAAYQAEAFMTHWATQGREPAAQAWVVAAAAAQRAEAWYPAANGEYQDRLGRIHSWRFYQRPFGPAATLAVLVATPEVAAIDASRRQALAAYREATRLRPHQPDGWARLAHAKLYLLELDAESTHAYATAARLGPFIGAVQQELAQIGLQAWHRMSGGQRAIALAAAVAVLQAGGHAAQDMARQLAAMGLTDQICQRVRAGAGRLPQLCLGQAS